MTRMVYSPGLIQGEKGMVPKKYQTLLFLSRTKMKSGEPATRTFPMTSFAFIGAFTVIFPCLPRNTGRGTTSSVNEESRSIRLAQELSNPAEAKITVRTIKTRDRRVMKFMEILRLV